MAENLIYILSISNIIFFFLRQQMRPSANKTKKKKSKLHMEIEKERRWSHKPLYSLDMVSSQTTNKAWVAPIK